MQNAAIPAAFCVLLAKMRKIKIAIFLVIVYNIHNMGKEVSL